MTRRAFDIVTVGGGLGGAALARAMAERGARVLVLERERRFADRVRGEALMPWGVAEARALGLESLLLATCAHPLPWLDIFVAGLQIVHRDMPASTAHAAPWLAFYHPAMQEAVLESAAGAGADVRRGVRVSGVKPGPAVVLDDGDAIPARLAGRLAMFEGADAWLDHPYRDGVALVGDAAAASDPTWGQGMSLTLRDVRTLRDRLVADDDWTAAGHAYAAEHDRYYGVVH